MGVALTQHAPGSKLVFHPRFHKEMLRICGIPQTKDRLTSLYVLQFTFFEPPGDGLSLAKHVADLLKKHSFDERTIFKIYYYIFSNTTV